jgi:hypothetical protein
MRRWIAASLLVTSLVVGGPSGVATASCTRVVGIGDSVMLGAASQLRARGITVDARESRQFSTQLNPHGGYTVIVHLGTNGPFTRASLERLIKNLGYRRIVLVTIQLPSTKRYRYESSVNALIRSMPGKFGNVKVAEWNGLSSYMPGLLTRDGIHLTRAGAKAYANLVAGRAC